MLLLLCAVCWKLSFTLRVHTTRLVRSRTSTRSHHGTESSNERTIGGSRHAGNALGRFGPGFHRGCVRRGAQGVNPAVSRRAGPSSARNERKRLGEPVLLFLRDNQTCPRKDSSGRKKKAVSCVEFPTSLVFDRLFGLSSYTMLV